MGSEFRLIKGLYFTKIEYKLKVINEFLLEELE
jgi:hypothetical protein